jgi:hypothetical protein
MLGKDPEYLAFRLKKIKLYLRNKYGPESLGILKRIDGFEGPEERKKRRSFVRELHKQNYSLREIGALMNLSGQAVNSIIKSTTRYKSHQKIKSEAQTKLF